MNILITGASKGIGKAVSLKFCQNQGNRLFLVSRDLKLLESLKNQCLKMNPQTELYLYPFDLGNSDDLKTLVENIILDASKIDILINNAGSLYNKRFSEISQAEIFSMFQVNFFAPANLIRFLIPALSNSEKAHVVNIGSMGGFQGSSKYPGLAYYSASKAALAVLTECLAEEFNGLNIAFNCLALGAVQTEMFSAAFPGAKAPVNANEMADFIVDFAQNAQHKFNGKIIPVTLQNTDYQD
jgi:short-subunit dehydrogenase